MMSSIFNYFFFFSVSCSILSISPFSLSLLTSDLYFLSWLCLSLSASYSTFLLLACFTLFFAAFASLFSPLKKLSFFPFSVSFFYIWPYFSPPGYDIFCNMVSLLYYSSHPVLISLSLFFLSPQLYFGYPKPTLHPSMPHSSSSGYQLIMASGRVLSWTTQHEKDKANYTGSQWETSRLPDTGGFVALTHTHTLTYTVIHTHRTNPKRHWNRHSQRHICIQ